MNNNHQDPGRGLDAMLNPTSVAVIGGSDDPTRIGGRPIRYMKDAGFPGVIYPVNPKHDRIQGLKAYPDIGSVTGPVDLAIVAVPAAVVPRILEECAAKGVRSAVVFSAGFAESGQAGEESQRRISAIARASGMRVLGPNCLGVYNAEIGFFATFSTTLEDRLPHAGPVGLVSQSGAYGSHLSLLAAQRNIGIRYWITTGNESDVTVPECIDWLADRPNVSVIVAYAEGIASREALLRALDKARARRKPVIFMKVGTTAVGARAARSHTASLAGSDAVYDAVLRQFGAHRAHNTEEMLDIAYAASFGVLPASPRVALMTISGGVGVQMADAAVHAGLDVAPMSSESQAALKRELPFAAPGNPVDITAQAFNDIQLVSSNLDRILNDGQYDSVVAFFTYVASAASMVDPIRESLKRAKQAHPNCVLALSIIGPPEVIRQYEEVGCPVFEDPTRAVKAVAALVRLRESFDRATGAFPALPRQGDPLPSGPVSEHDASQLLAAAGLPMSSSRLATAEDEAVRAAESIGYPVAMKVCSPDILHKTEIDGVALGIDNSTEVRTTFGLLTATARTAAPDARVDGILVAKMMPAGIDVIVGVNRDPTFGPVVMVGLGGVFVEVFEDISLRVAPFDEREAHRMIRELKGFALLSGARGRPPGDVDALAQALVRLSEFAATHSGHLESAEINPLRVFPDGQGVVGLDAVVVPRPRSA
jgi:acyl-CoA synthetase (NDP forming)